MKVSEEHLLHLQGPRILRVKQVAGNVARCVRHAVFLLGLFFDYDPLISARRRVSGDLVMNCELLFGYLTALISTKLFVWCCIVG